MSEAIEKFELHVPESMLTDLRERLARTRLPDAIDGAGWDYGVDVAYLRELLAYWEHDFDWRAQERELNQFDHFRTEIDSLRVHFIHQRSPEPAALPLVITHGWPGSFVEFRKAIGPLTDPAAHGGRREDAFHVICPSIPGYGFSDSPGSRGFDVRALGETLIKLMARLGYERYGAQGGDWGAMATSYVGALDPGHCCGIHLNLVIAPNPGEDPKATLTQKELEALEDARRFMSEEAGYQAIQGTKPQTLGYALNDSPAGLAAWIVEKFRTWSDCEGDVERRFTKDEMLTNITLYWVTGTATSSARLYYESRKSGRFGALQSRVEVPTGCAIFPKELFRPPRRWAEKSYNVRYWSELPEGGHFAAMEVPELFVEDVRKFFRTVR